MTIWRMRIEGSILKATDTHSEYVTEYVFHYNNGCKNVPQSYVIPSLPVMFPAAAQS
jgi:hypothetical protein